MDYIQLDGYIILVPWVEDSRLNINRYTQRKTNLINHKTAVNRGLTTHIVMWSVTWSGHVMSRARKTHLTRSPSDLFDHKTGFFELLSSTQAYNHNLILSFNVFFEILEFLGTMWYITFIWKRTWNFIFHLWTARFRRRDNLGMVYVTDRNVIVYLKVSWLCHILFVKYPLAPLKHTLMT